MGGMLVLCANCQRHVQSHDEACPFCSSTTPKPAAPFAGRISRSVMVAAAVVGCSSISPQPAYGACVPPPDAVTLSSPCGIMNATTTCAGSITHPTTSETVVGPITADCTINVELGDGTEHTVDVTFGSTMPGGFCGSETFTGVTSNANVDFGSATCTLPTTDAGSDSPSSDAQRDAPSD